MNLILNVNALPRCRQDAWTERDDCKVKTNGPFIDLLALYRGQWHYISTVKKESITE